MFMEVLEINMEYPSLSTPPSGSIRFNTDSTRLEIYNGEAWWEMDSTSPEAQTGGSRGIMLGGYEQPEGGVVNTIQYINIATTGDAQDFGDLQAIGYGNAAFGNRTRGIYLDNSPHNQYITISTTGNSISLGESATSFDNNGAANEIRGIYSYSDGTNTMEYFTIASSAKGVDFGDMATTGITKAACCGASPTRHISGGGYTSPNAAAGFNRIEYVTFQTTGNATDFGDLNVARGGWRSTGGNAVRGIYGGGYLGGTPGGNSNVIEYTTVATLGNATDFGDTSTVTENPAIMTSSTRAVIAGGNSGNPSPNNVLPWIEYVQIMTTGNSVDFGDYINGDKMGNMGAISNGHGGLG